MEDKKREASIGDVVAVTAEVTGYRPDGGYNIKPVGFDYDFQFEGEGVDPTRCTVDFYTVDPPHQVLVKAVKRGDRVTWIEKEEANSQTWHTQRFGEVVFTDDGVATVLKVHDLRDLSVPGSETSILAEPPTLWVPLDKDVAENYSVVEVHYTRLVEKR